MLRSLAGWLAVAALKFLSQFPPHWIVAMGTPWLPFYALCRPSIRQRLGRLPHPLTSLAYYRMRLRLAALSLRHLTGHENDVPVRVKGEEHYHAALATGKPVALLGWHQGPVELLHRIPSIPENGRPFFIFTAGGFAPRLTQLLRRGRKQSGKQIVSPESQHAALRSWARQSGVLAVMMDQVPGRPRDWLSLWNGKVELPCPRNLMDWLSERNAVCLAVSTKLEEDGSIVFEYQPVQPDEKNLGLLIEKAIAAAPEQYNWSYPKIRVSAL